MTRRRLEALPVPIIGTLLVLCAAASPQAAELAEESSVEKVYRPIIPATGTLFDPGRRVSGGDAGVMELGLQYVEQNSFMFGQYNGLHERGPALIGNLRWQDFSNSDSQWRVSMSDLGLETREGEISWGIADKLRLQLGFDSQLQVRNNSGRTPFGGTDNHLTLPDDWNAASTTGGFTSLNDALRSFDRELARDTLSASLQAKLNENWRLEGGLSYEDKQGTADISGAIYSDASTGDAAFLPAPVDYRTTELDLGLLYGNGKLSLEGRVNYSDFDNQQELLRWENPYRSRSTAAGGMSLAPDNSQVRTRLTGLYVFNPSARLQFDGSYALASQDQDFLDYSINPAATVTQPLPRDSFDGEVAIATLNSTLWLRPLQKLDVEAYYKATERDYDNPRDGYRYIRGDGSTQPRQALTVYNTAHDYLSQTMGLDATLRLPGRRRLSLDYAFEKIERENAAVEETEEDRVTLTYRVQPMDALTARVELLYGDRAASTYVWDQRYYALLDVNLINAIPDNQRYSNHPELSQFHLANRVQTQGKLDVNWLLNNNWNLHFNALARKDDYDKTTLGLTDSRWQRYHLSVNYTPSDTVSASLYGGMDYFESQQLGRAFRGGQEKNAFEVFPPLPQASDPDRDWYLNSIDDTLSVGANVQWRLAEDIVIAADYRFADTQDEQNFKSYGAPDVTPADLPAVDTRLHHVSVNGTWQMHDDFTLRLEYQYYDFTSNDWALDGVLANTIDNVLTFGASNPDEQIHHIGASVIYRWQ
jgi:MtrB/PioB family decaheme-associated outer membrane protein